MAIKLCILRTDTVHADLLAQFGDYPSMFGQLLAPFADEIHCSDVDAREFVQRRSIPAINDYDAFLITGSKHSVYDPLPWISVLVDYVTEALTLDKKVVGICFGHQLMAHFFGGRVGPSAYGWGVGVHENRMTAVESWMNEGDDLPSLNLLFSHKDQVLELPDSASVYMCTEHCPVGGFTIGSQVLTVQAHPEFVTGYSRSLMHLRRDLMPQQTYLRGLESLALPTDSERFARWMVNFLKA